MNIRTTTLSSALAISTALSLSACGPDSPSGKDVSSGTYELRQFPQSGTRNGFNAVVKDIEGANKSVSMEMYSLNDDLVEDALINAKKRGVDVTVVLNSAFNGNKFNKSAYDYLKNNGVIVKWAPTGYIFHIKTYVIDKKVVYISTANLNEKNYKDTYDAMIVDKNKKHVQAIGDTLDADATLIGKPKSNTFPADGLVWSPGSQGTFVEFIKSANKSIRFSSEEIKGESVINAIIEIAKSGKKCNILLNDEADMAFTVKKLTSAGCHVTQVSKSGDKPYVHIKQIILDDDRVLVGSQNDSVTSLQRNRELSVIVNDKNIVASMAKTFDTYAK